MLVHVLVLCKVYSMVLKRCAHHSLKIEFTSSQLCILEHARAASTTGLCVHLPLILVSRPGDPGGETVSTVRCSIPL